MNISKIVQSSRRLLAAGASSLLCCLAASAEDSTIHNCDGRFTNRPCEELADKRSGERTVLSPDAARARSLKESLLHELTMKNIEAKRKYEVSVDLTYSRELCLRLDSSLEQCRDELQTMEDRLDNKISTAVALKGKELEEKKKAEEQLGQNPTDQQTTIIIRDEYPIYNPWDPRYRGRYPRRKPPYANKPYPPMNQRGSKSHYDGSGYQLNPPP